MVDNLLYETKKDFQKLARLLPEIEVNGVKTNRYEDYDITVLADNYCKATDEKDEISRNIYIAALILRFWYKIDKMYYKLRGTNFDRADVFNRLYQCIEVACQYRAWQDPNKHTNAQACINQVLAGRGVPAMLYEANLQKNSRIVYTLDREIDSESGTTQLDLIGDDSDEQQMKATMMVSSLVQTLIDNNKIVEAVIADNMAYKDVYKQTKETYKDIDFEGNEVSKTKIKTTFWPFQLVKELNLLKDDFEYYDDFQDRYIISKEKLLAAKSVLDTSNNQKKYKFIDSARESMKKYFNIFQS